MTRFIIMRGMTPANYKAPTSKKYSQTIDRINNNFLKIELGNAYFIIWENICLAGNELLCELIHPDIEPTNFQENNFNKTLTLSKVFLNNVKNHIYAILPSPKY